jgi:hypothetical protein
MGGGEGVESGCDVLCRDCDGIVVRGRIGGSEG